MVAWETLPKIVWGANTLNFGYPPEAATSWGRPRPNSEVVESDSGDAEDAWISRYDHFLAGDVHWIPSANTTNPSATGWDGATGWQAFLQYAWQRNTFLWYPDKAGVTNYSSRLVMPDISMDRPAVDPGVLRSLSLVIKSAATPPVPYLGY